MFFSEVASLKLRLNTFYRNRGTYMSRLILTAILLGLLTACGISGIEPSTQVVQRGLIKFNELVALQLNQTARQQLSGRPQLPGFKINRLVITEQQPLVIQDLPAYRVQGTYNLTIRLPKRRVTQQQNPFDIYLQRQKEGKTWRLVLPQSTSKDSAPVRYTYSID